MKIYKVGPEELSDYEYEYLKNDLDWFVYWYEAGSWEGWGEAIGYKDGILYVYSLGHCSCYGPLDGSGGNPVTVENYLESDDIHDTDVENKDVRNKVLELLHK